MKKEIPDTVAVALREWLTPKGVRFFQLLKSFHGTVSPVLRLNAKRKFIPAHPIHFREGMQVRNFLRSLPECADWDAHDYDESWAAAVEAAIVKPK